MFYKLIGMRHMTQHVQMDRFLSEVTTYLLINCKRTCQLSPWTQKSYLYDLNGQTDIMQPTSSRFFYARYNVFSKSFIRIQIVLIKNFISCV